MTTENDAAEEGMAALSTKPTKAVKEPKTKNTDERIRQKVIRDAEKSLVKTRKNLSEKYPHAILTTLAFDEGKQKYKANIKCESCQNEERVVYTSDMHQIKQCMACQTAARRTAATTRREDEKKVREQIRSTKPKTVKVSDVKKTEKEAPEIVTTPVESELVTQE